MIFVTFDGAMNPPADAFAAGLLPAMTFPCDRSGCFDPHRNG